MTQQPLRVTAVDYLLTADRLPLNIAADAQNTVSGWQPKWQHNTPLSYRLPSHFSLLLHSRSATAGVERTSFPLFGAPLSRPRTLAERGRSTLVGGELRTACVRIVAPGDSTYFRNSRVQQTSPQYFTAGAIAGRRHARTADLACPE